MHFLINMFVLSPQSGPGRYLFGIFVFLFNPNQPFYPMRKLMLLCSFLAASMLGAQAKTVRALFIGNSYTAANDLPNLVSQLATGSQDVLTYSTSAPGGYTLQQHFTNSTTLNLISQGNWDYVILQEQSQLPSFPDAQVNSNVYPYAKKLDSVIHVHNPCAKTVFYVTWGRKNGDAGNCPNYPPVCTYQGMDSLLQLRYTNMAQQNAAVLSPVAMVWRRLRSNGPNSNLYDPDESHPSIQGSFAAACTFYSILFQKSPQQSTYNSSLNTADAQLIKSTVVTTVYDSLSYWNRFVVAAPAVVAGFTNTVNGATATFANTSQNAASYDWDFGDGQTSQQAQPAHTYTATGTYTVRLIASKCNDKDTLSQTVEIATLSLQDIRRNNLVQVYPIPAEQHLSLSYDADIRVTDMYLTDLSGKTILKQFNASLKNITVPGLASGSYWLCLRTNKGLITKKIVLR